VLSIVEVDLTTYTDCDTDIRVKLSEVSSVVNDNTAADIFIDVDFTLIFPQYYSMNIILWTLD